MKYHPISAICVETAERRDFISLFARLAEGISTSYLHDRRQIPYVTIDGSHGSGKSLVPEVMIKQWSDDHDPADCFSKEPDRMFMEVVPCAASGGLSAIFSVAGQKARISFKSWNDYSDLEFFDAEKTMIATHPQIAGGMIFHSNIESHQSDLKPWLSVTVKRIPYKNVWERETTLKVFNEKLWSDMRFRTQWHGIEASLHV